MDMDIVHTQLNRMWIGFSVVALTVAALLVVSGADLRSKLPVMRDWLEIEEQLKLKQRDINRDLGETIIKDTTAPASARLDQKQQEYELAKDEHTKKREETLSFGTPTLHTDWLVGLGIYMFLVVLGAIKMIISSDPYFEYQLLAQSLRGRPRKPSAPGGGQGRAVELASLAHRALHGADQFTAFLALAGSAERSARIEAQAPEWR